MALVDLNKAAASLKVSLAKAGIHTAPEVDLAFDLDVSGSFDDEHQDGLTNDLLVRLTPWGMVFDPDQQLDVFTFSDGRRNAYHVGTVTPVNCDGYVRKNIINQVPGYNGMTDYSYVLEKNLEHFGWINQGKQQSSGLLGRAAGVLFGNSPEASPQPSNTPRKSIVIFVTDGANDDKSRTQKVITESQERGDGVYFLFMGVSNQQTSFNFIRELGDDFDNVGFIAVSDVTAWVQQDDEQINAELLDNELIEWLKQ